MTRPRLPRRWSHLSLQGKGLVVVTLPVVVMLLGLGVLAVSERQLRDAEERVTQTLEVRTEIFRLAIAVRDNDAAVAAGLLTGDVDLLRSAEDAPAEIFDRLVRIRTLVQDKREQVERVDRLKPLLEQRLRVVGEAARLRTSAQPGPPQVPSDLLRRTAELEGHVRSLMDDMESVELQLLDQRLRRAETTRQRQLLAGLLAGLSGVAGAVAAVVLFTRGVVRAVRRVEDTACRIEQREDLPPLGPSGDDEVGRLERTLHSTAARLADQEEAAQRETQWLASFVAVQQAVIGSTEVGDAASRASAAAVELLGAAGCTVELLEGDQLVCCAASGDLADRVGRRTPMADSAAAAAVASSALVRLDSEATQGRTTLVAPLEHDSQVVGAFTVAAPADGSLSYRDGNAIELLASLLGVTIARAQAQTALAAARDSADAANRAKSEFLSRMSHELRTPLNAILGFGQLLQFDGLSPDQQDSVDQILHGGRHLLDLINEVLDISRIEAGRMRLSVEPVDVGEVLDDCLDLMRPLAVAASVDIAHATPPECQVLVAADKQRLKQALLNLLANAIKYNRPQGRAWVTCEPVGDRVRVHVADTGIGIDLDELDRLFVPFERLSGAASVEGTGLGLALAKRLVEAMGGTLDVDTSRDDGTTFTIELPVASSREPLRLPDGEFGSSFEPARGTEATVLYVEDNASNVRLVERILVTRPKVRLVTAPNAAAGLEAAFEHRPDIVLLDLHLPDADGRDVLRRLKDDARTASTPVVVISADATEVRRLGLIQAGAVDYLTKPLDVGTFLDILDRLAP